MPVLPGVLFRYISGEFLFATGVAFAFFFFIFFINQLLLLAEDILQKDVPFVEVALLIIYSLPAIIALSVPFAVLVGTLMAVGRLSGDNEVVAMRAGGVPMRVAFVPVLVFATLLSVGSFFVNDYLLPLGTLNFGRLYRELLYANPALELEPYSVRRYQDDVLITGAVEPGRLDDLVIIDDDGRGNRRLIVADGATLEREGDPRAISLRLESVTVHTAGSADDYSVAEAETLNYNILLQDITIALRNPGPREMSAFDVLADIRAREAAFAPRVADWERRSAVALAEAAWVVRPGGGGISDERAANTRSAVERVAQLANDPPVDRTLQIYRLEYHKKFSIPLAAVSFVILAFPLGLFSRRSGRGVGFGIGLLIATAYWAMLIAGQTLGTQRTDVSPALAMWAPNIVFVAAGAVAMVARARV